MKGLYYKLEGKTPVECTLMEFALSGESDPNKGVVNKTKLSDGVEVSTVFLGINHAFDGIDPILFETMIFGGEHDQFQERYSTWDEAEEGHKRAVQLAITPNAKQH